MILEKQTENVILEEGDVQESTDMVLDLESATFLMRMLSKFYSDAVGSLIRETASNALDSHRQAKTNDPIIVSFGKTDSYNYEFSVEDFGVGIDDNDVENIIKKYGKSTKRNIADQLGAFGLGFKSPLAYSSSFYFITRKNGIERKYMMYESESEINKIDLLYDKKTTERNGVKIVVPVKYEDRYDFEKKIKEQLAYFENVYFHCPGIDNNFKIVRDKDFQYSELANTSQLHISLDNVYYPIDWNKLGLAAIYLPVALRFSLSDGLVPIPNREQLKYTTEAKAKIIAKIKEVCTLFTKKYNEQMSEVTNVNDVINFFLNSKTLTFEKFSIKMEDIVHHSTVKINEPRFKGLKYLTSHEIHLMRDALLSDYEVTHDTGYNKNHIRGTHYHDTHYSTLIGSNVFTYSGELKTGNYRTYLKETVLKGVRGYCRFLKKAHDIKLGISINTPYKQSYYKILKLNNFPKNQWRARILDFQTVKKSLVDSFTNLDNVKIPQQWLDDRKKQRIQKMVKKGTNVRRVKLKGEVSLKVSDSLNRYVNGKNCKFTQQVIKMEEAHKAKHLLVYGTQEKEELMQSLYNVFSTDSIKFGILSEREMKNIKDIKLHNWINIDKFMEGKHIWFKRAVTSYLIGKLETEYNYVFSKTEILDQISSKLAEDIDKLNEYTREFGIKTYSNDEVFKTMLSVAEEYNLFDESIYYLYKKVKNSLAKIPNINVLFSKIYRGDDSMIPFAKIIFRYYKLKMNYNNYVLPLNETPVEELTEDEIEQEII